jgi:hypothetical protein
MRTPRNLIGGIATMAIGAAYLAMASGIRASALSDSVGPAGFPKALAWAMMGLGLILCVQALMALRAQRSTVAAGRTPSTDDADTEGDVGLHGIFRATGMLALGVAYLLMVRYLGYVVSIGLLIVAASVYLGAAFSWTVVAIGLAGAVAYWVVFVLVLGIPQPPGLLGGIF